MSTMPITDCSTFIALWKTESLTLFQN